MQKAQHSMIIAMVLVVATLIVFLIYIQFFAEELDRDTQIKICQGSVFAHSKTKIAGITTYDDFKCQTMPLEITDKITDQNQNKINKQIADAMADCWTQWLEGKEDLFSEPTVYCSICHHITFKDTEKTLQGTKEFLFSRNMPNSDNSYLEYLNGYKTSDIIISNTEDLLSNDILDTSKEYSIIFTYARGKDKVKEFLSAIGLGTEGKITTGLHWFASRSSPLFISHSAAAITRPYIESLTDNPSADQWAANVVLREHTPEQFSELGCEYFPVEQ